MSDIYVVFFIILVIWLGIGGYVTYLHVKIGNLEKELDKIRNEIKSLTVRKAKSG